MSTIPILADASLPNLHAWFPSPFKINTYQSETDVPRLLKDNALLICRSTLKINDRGLKGSAIRYVATASSGIDHIDTDAMKQLGIQVFDAKGCNAPAVADYVVSSLAFLYANNRVHGNKAGIIGMGEVGSRVAQRLEAIGWELLTYDPLKATINPMAEAVNLSELSECDLLCVHANLHQTPPFPSYHLLDAQFLSLLKANTIIINASRGEILDEEALLKNPRPLIYCTDVYANEPNPNPKIIDYASLCTPHIAGHSIEAKENALKLLSQQIHAVYGLEGPSGLEPNPMKITPITTVCQPSMTWVDLALQCYNPILETQELKAATDKKNAFLSQRKAHQFRHDFNRYDLVGFDKQLQPMMGTPIKNN